jgi:allophanate hydrolase subunit 2
MQCGTVQLHPDGSLMVMGPDHPVTGGYLQPMTVISSERWKLAQLSPGGRVRFVVQPP